jgi:hypothetical protein
MTAERSSLLPAASLGANEELFMANSTRIDRQPITNNFQSGLFSGHGSIEIDSSMQPFSFNESLFVDEFPTFQSYPSSPLLCTSVFSAPPSWCTWSRGGVSSLIVMADTSMASFESNSNFLVSLQVENPYAQHNANLIIQALRALPTMMLRRHTFPWFIHSHAHLLSKPSGTALPRALSSCMSIAQIFASRTAETKPFLWCAIRAEYRRFKNEVRIVTVNPI